MTTIDVFSGFLGAGKTTLIKKLIKEAFAGEQLVLIENEFGEIGIDGGFMKDAGIEVTEMNQGCICCSLVGDFGTALGEVLEKYSPDRIIIEPSGVGKLSDVIRAVAGILDENSEDTPDEDLVTEGHVGGNEVSLGGAVTVADATKVKMYMKNFGEFYNNQIESAKTIVLSRTGSISDDKLNAALIMIKDKNDRASIITTPWDQIDGKQILSAMDDSDSLKMELLAEEDKHDHDHEHEHHHHDHDHDEHEHHHDHDHEHGHHHHHHHADDIFSSVGIESAKKYDEAELEEILKKLSKADEDGSTGEFGNILRAKGIVPATEGEWFHFDMVPGEYEIRRGSADYTGRLCVIGAELKEDAIKELFA